MPGVDQLASDLAAVAARLKEIGDDGLVRELQRQIGKAVEPVPGQIRAGLKPHLPDRYAEVLDADLAISRRSFTDPDGTRVSIYASPRGIKKRRLRLTEAGLINHPVFAQGPRRTWTWVNGQTGGMKPGWFTDPVEEAAPQVREAIERALNDVAAKAAGKGA